MREGVREEKREEGRKKERKQTNSDNRPKPCRSQLQTLLDPSPLSNSMQSSTVSLSVALSQVTASLNRGGEIRAHISMSQCKVRYRL